MQFQPGGSAHESGGLRIGHVILEVDSRPMAGLEHKEAARSIAEAFKRRDTAQMELLVTQLPTKLKVWTGVVTWRENMQSALWGTVTKLLLDPVICENVFNSCERDSRDLLIDVGIYGSV